MPYRIFLSSPSDVAAERQAAKAVIAQVNAGHDPPPFLVVDWQDRYYTALQSFQDQIERPSRCDIVISILWSRAGTELPDEFRRPDGTLPTGTEYEIEDALTHATLSQDKTPDLWLYRKTAPVSYSETDVAYEKAQRERVVAYFNKWVRSEKGQFSAAFTDFSATAEFASVFQKHLGSWLRERESRAVWTQGSPYRGLDVFEERHQPIYFGRSREIARARARLLANAARGHRILVVTGPSGSGKSSMLRAGLIPRLRVPGGLGETSQRLHCAVFKPSEIAAENWASALAERILAESEFAPFLTDGDFAAADTFARQLRSGASAGLPLAGALRRANIAQHGVRNALLIAVDQFEEIFSWPRQETAVFCAMLAGFCAVPDVFVVTSMRSDFLHQLADEPSLRKLLGYDALRGNTEAECVLVLTAPTAAETVEMIHAPAKAAGLTFESSADGERTLPSLIEQEALGQPLPALQYLLDQLYARRSENLLTLEAYDALGGVAGAMANRGEAVLRGLEREFGTKTVRTAFAGVFRQLVRISGAELPAARTAGEDQLQSSPNAAELVRRFRAAGLLISDRQRLRIAHESLIGRWKSLSALVDGERSLLQARSRIAEMALEHAKSPSPSKLLAGYDLTNARHIILNWGNNAFAAEGGDVDAFVKASVRRAQTQWAMLAAGAALVVMLIAGAVFLWQQQEQQKSKAEYAEALRSLDRVLALAESAGRPADARDAIRQASRVNGILDDHVTRSALVRALTGYPPSLIGSTGLIEPKSVSTGGDTVFAMLPYDSDKLLVFDRAGRVTETELVSEGGFDVREIIAVSLQNNGELYTLGKYGQLSRWRSEQSPEGQVLRLAWSSTTSAAEGAYYSEMGARLVVQGGNLTATATSGDGSLTVFHCKAEVCAAPATFDGNAKFALSPDGRWIAAELRGRSNSPANAAIGIFDVSEAGQPRSVTEVPAKEIRALNWVDDGSAISIADDDAIHLLAVRDGRMSGAADRVIFTAAARAGLQNRSEAASWWNDGGRVYVSIGKDGNAVLLSKTGTQLDLDGVVTIGGQPVHGARAMGDGKTVFAEGSGGGGLWSLAASPRPSLARDNAAVGMLRTRNPDGSLDFGWSTSTGFRMIIGPDAARNLVERELSAEYASYAPFEISLAPGERRLLAVTSPARGALIADLDRNMMLSGCESILHPRSKWLTASRLGFFSDSTSLTLCEMTDSGAQVASLTLDTGESPADAVDAAAALPDGSLVYGASNGTIWLRSAETGKASLLFNAETVGEEAGSAFTFALDRSGRWLIPTRNDELLKVYDVKERRVTSSATLAILDAERRNTVHVAFAPDDRHVAALSDSAGKRVMHVFRFAQEDGSLEPLFEFPLQDEFQTANGDSVARRIVWLGPNALQAGKQNGELLILDIDMAHLRSEAAEMAQGTELEHLARGFAATLPRE